jgi:predicted CoA-substrate-specific enzyme activase
MDENMCLPAKIVLGDIFELIERKNKFIVEWDNCGTCRQKTYGLIHESILRQAKINTEILTIQPRNLTGWLKKIIPNLSKSQERHIVRQALRDIWAFDAQIMEKQTKIPENKPKIGICGEIYTILEPASNLHLISRLEEQGAYIHNAFPLSQFVFKRLLKGKKRNRILWAIGFAYAGMYKEMKDWCIKKMERPDVDYKIFKEAEEITKRYFPKDTVGGHGKENITWTIYYALAGFDGVVHILPFPCMPEATVSALMDEISNDYNIPVNHLVFDQQFGEQNLITRAEAMVNLLRFKKEGLKSVLATRRSGFWLGLDVGSTSTKAVLLDGRTLEIVDYEYQFNNRNPINAIKSVTTEITKRHSDKKIIGGATTGSGRRLAKALTDAALAIDEISCQTIGCLIANPSVRSIIEIGGQDSKFISLDQSGLPIWFNMNSICSAGTGAFLSSAAREFKIPIEKLGTCARSAECSVTITGRCGVFAESDIVSKQQAGYPVSSIVQGLCRALAQNYLSNVCRSRKLEPPIIFTGAVALNEGVVDAFSEILSQEIDVHPNQQISGAIGAAILALNRNAIGGFESCKSETQFGSSTFNCRDCANECEVSLIYRDNSVVCALGSRCGKYEKFVDQNLNNIKNSLSI